MLKINREKAFDLAMYGVLGLLMTGATFFALDTWGHSPEGSNQNLGLVLTIVSGLTTLYLASKFAKRMHDPDY